MDMPDVVRSYFDADRRKDPDALAAAFSADAVVRDEGGCHQGVGTIRSWWVAANERYRHVAEPVEVTAADHLVSVRASVSGEFPGSPAMLDFCFEVKDGKIAALEIK